MSKDLLLVDPALAAMEQRGYGCDGYMLYFEVHRKKSSDEKFWHVCTGKCVSGPSDPITGVTASTTALYYFRNYSAQKGEQIVIDRWAPPYNLQPNPIVHVDWDEDEARGEFLLQEALLLLRNRHHVDDYMQETVAEQQSAHGARMHVLHCSRDYPSGGPYANGYSQGSFGQAGYLLSTVPSVRDALMQAPKCSIRNRLPYSGKWLHYNLTQLFNKPDLAELLKAAYGVICIKNIAARQEEYDTLMSLVGKKTFRKIADDAAERNRVFSANYDHLFDEVMK